MKTLMEFNMNSTVSNIINIIINTIIVIIINQREEAEVKVKKRKRKRKKIQTPLGIQINDFVLC